MSRSDFDETQTIAVNAESLELRFRLPDEIPAPWGRYGILKSEKLLRDKDNQTRMGQLRAQPMKEPLVLMESFSSGQVRIPEGPVHRVEANFRSYRLAMGRSYEDCLAKLLLKSP